MMSPRVHGRLVQVYIHIYGDYQWTVGRQVLGGCLSMYGQQLMRNAECRFAGAWMGGCMRKALSGYVRGLSKNAEEPNISQSGSRSASGRTTRAVVVGVVVVVVVDILGGGDGAKQFVYVTGRVVVTIVGAPDS
ncbi:hypothetical protein PLESTM_000251400 [Pleodorina starrii]|nr:hypothetical protein PLESTM_000251400 [Pleodorina starrii]